MCRINEMNVRRLKFDNMGWIHKMLNNVCIRVSSVDLKLTVHVNEVPGFMEVV